VVLYSLGQLVWLLEVVFPRLNFSVLQPNDYLGCLMDLPPGCDSLSTFLSYYHVLGRLINKFLDWQAIDHVLFLRILLKSHHFLLQCVKNMLEIRLEGHCILVSKVTYSVIIFINFSNAEIEHLLEV